MEDQDHRVAPLLAAIREGGGAVAVLPPGDGGHLARQARLEAAFPFVFWGRIDWASVPGAEIVRTEDTDAIVARIRAWLAADGASGELCVMWSDGGLPMLVLPASAVSHHAEEIVMLSWDTWIFPPDAAWCIERYHEGELCFGRGVDAGIPSAP